jgi:GNAT superfamily N-acetyltransferase
MTNPKESGLEISVIDEITGETRKKFLSRAELLDAFFPLRRDALWPDITGAFPQHATPNAITYSRSGDRGCLVAYDAGGDLVGVLFYHFTGDQAGKIDLVVRKDKRRQGFGTKLWQEAKRRWPIDLSRQIMTPEGSQLIEAFKSKMRSRAIEKPKGTTPAAMHTRKIRD